MRHIRERIVRTIFECTQLHHNYIVMMNLYSYIVMMNLCSYIVMMNLCSYIVMMNLCSYIVMMNLCSYIVMMNLCALKDCFDYLFVNILAIYVQLQMPLS